MGLFSERKPYTAISAETEALLDSGAEADPAKLLNLADLIRGSRPPDAGAHEAGRVLRKRLKHGTASDQRHALALVEMLVDNGIRGKGLVAETGLGEQLCALATSHAGHGRADVSKSSRAARHAQSVLWDWSKRKDPSLNRWYKQAGLADRGARPRRHSMHPDDDLDEAVFGGDGAAPGRARALSASSRRSRPPSRPSSRSPSPVDVRGASMTTTIATAHNVSTRLTNALITNRPGSRETAEYYRQATQLRRRVIQLVHDQSPDVQRYVGQLVQANDELVAALQAHDAVASGEQLPAQDDHAPVTMPSAPRSPPSPGLGEGLSSDDEDVPARSGKADLFDLEDPFADHNEQQEHPKHTPFW